MALFEVSLYVDIVEILSLTKKSTIIRVHCILPGLSEVDILVVVVVEVVVVVVVVVFVVVFVDVEVSQSVISPVMHLH